MKNNRNESRRIDISNVFSSNRLSLGNSFESGESVTLGLNFKKEKVNTDNKIDKIEEYIDFKLASVFRLDEENNIPTNSTLNKKNSNIFGQFNFKPIKNISLGYDFSLTNDLNKFELPSTCIDSSRIDHSTIVPIPFILPKRWKFSNITNEANKDIPSLNTD